MKKFLFLCTFLSVFLLLPLAASAIPALGVQTDALAIPDGYAVNNGDEIMIWAESKDVDVYLLTTAYGAGFSFTPEGESAIGFSQAYQPETWDPNIISFFSDETPYWGINVTDYLHTIAPDAIYLVNNSAFDDDWFSVSGTITLSGDWGEGEWLFVVADYDGNDVIGGGEFSPPTTSATSVPEPATMFLLGTGLIGLVGLSRVRMKK